MLVLKIRFNGQEVLNKIGALQAACANMQHLQDTINEKKEALAKVSHQLKTLASEALDFKYSRSLEATELKK